MATVAEQIKSMRKHRGMSTKELAERCGVVPETIRRVEKGTTFPGKELMADITLALDFTLNVRGVIDNN